MGTIWTSAGQGESPVVATTPYFFFFFFFFFFSREERLTWSSVSTFR